MNPLGLRTRLALVFATGFAVLLGLGALGLYLHLARSYRRDFDHGLSDAARGVRALFQLDRPEFGSASATAVHVVGELAYGDRTLVAFDSSGHFVVASQRLPGEPYFNDVPASGPPRRLSTVVLRDGPARIIRVPLDGVQVVIAMGTLPLERRLVRLRRSLVTVLPVILVLGAVVGAWGSGLVLRPIVRVAESAERISEQVEAGATGFTRLSSHAAGDEISSLTDALNLLVDRLGSALERERGVAERQRQFLADVAHELRTPVAILRSEAEVTLRAKPDPVLDREALERIATESAELGTLVGDLLLIARGDHNGLQPAQERLYLDDLVTPVLNRVRALPQAANRELRHGEFEAAPVCGDRPMLERALLALVHNALLHAPGSAIEISSGSAAGNGSGGGTSWVTVRDFGPGVAPELRQRIFDRFARGTATVAGTGLGLAIARSIAEAHGGTLTLDPVDQGAAFTLRLPAPATPTA